MEGYFELEIREFVNIEVTMKYLVLFLSATLLLVAGCAKDRAPKTGEAPSKLAGVNDPNGGWSVPPGQSEVTDPGYKPAEEGELNPYERPQNRTTPGASRENGDAVSRIKEAQVKPLVPAFPARMRQERVNALRRIHFGFDRWDLSDAAKAILNENARWLKANPDVRVRIEGHTDERGTGEYNLALGERRALKVRGYLIFKGIPAENLKTASFGEEMPLAPAAGEGAWSINRRAEFSRVKKPKVSRIGTGHSSG